MSLLMPFQNTKSRLDSIGAVFFLQSRKRLNAISKDSNVNKLRHLKKIAKLTLHFCQQANSLCGSVGSLDQIKHELFQCFRIEHCCMHQRLRNR